ncbi:hypothetical protein BJ875DRAFT_184222 [Amylocarpus encephaloides]|uniref:RING-type domain-containing protein n=1 Tax=Amylocarpus encephaloides TaxID=45428 RepID=A0A9P7YNR1_9HELO|nr:hypothetical protein BJ875DRAFT_184222 [Amylocarpus encephaloides]
MASPYFVEHGVKPETSKRASRRPDMSSFFAQLEINQSTNSRAQPTPADEAALDRMLRDQFASLVTSSHDDENRHLLEGLMEQLQDDEKSKKVAGVPQTYIDELERVPKKYLKRSEKCPICAEPFLEDEYPLVVVLSCHPTHRFDLECVAPWLLRVGTCPLDRKDLLKKKEIPKAEDDDEEDDEGGMFG